jgi:hypothetical protein
MPEYFLDTPCCRGNARWKARGHTGKQHASLIVHQPDDATFVLTQLKWYEKYTAASECFSTLKRWLACVMIRGDI